MVRGLKTDDMKKPSQEEYAAMSPEEKNYWFIMVQRMHQTMWGINPHMAEWYDQETVEATVREIVSFFGLPMPKMQEVENTVAKISTNEDSIRRSETLSFGYFPMNCGSRNSPVTS